MRIQYSLAGKNLFSSAICVRCRTVVSHMHSHSHRGVKKHSWR
uniref:Uncharacterized protein n=1 Tax=Arundo donax TaxID=35708 RepID=A0A0A8YG37_ARUDO